MGLGVIRGPIYLCVFVCLCLVCVLVWDPSVLFELSTHHRLSVKRIALYISHPLPLFRLSPSFLLSLALTLTSSFSFSLYWSHPFVLSSPSQSPSPTPMSLGTCQLSINPSSLTLSILPYFSILCFCLTYFKVASTLLDSAYTSSIPPAFTLYFSNFSEWEPSNLEAAHLSVDRRYQTHTHTQTDNSNHPAAHLSKPICTCKRLLLTQWFLRWPCVQPGVESWPRWSSVCRVCRPGTPQSLRSHSPPAAKK